MRRATDEEFFPSWFALFLSTLSLRRATDLRQICHDLCKISIHALLAESDQQDGHQHAGYPISIHALLAESDYGTWTPNNTGILFLSTLSLRRATLLTGYCPVHDIDFYPRSPCGERLCLYRLPLIALPISIHALLAESDLVAPVLAVGRTGYFYPRSPCGERPLPRSRPGSGFPISIHALLAESDCRPICKYGLPLIFLSTLSLRRATIFATICRLGVLRFLSTLSLRRATTNRRELLLRYQVFLSTLSLRRATLADCTKF